MTTMPEQPDELDKLLFELEDAVWCSRGDNASENEAAKQRVIKAKAAIRAYTARKVLAELKYCYTHDTFDTPPDSVNGKMADIALNVQNRIRELEAQLTKEQP